jgi:cell division protein FtsB
VDTDHGCITVQNYKTDVDIIANQIRQLQKQLKKLKKRNIDKDGINSVEQQIQTLDNALQLCLKNRTVKIITYQGQTAVEISNESK